MKEDTVLEEVNASTDLTQGRVLRKGTWTEEEDAMLKRLVMQEAYSFGAAASMMTRHFKKNFTRNMTISRAHRIGLGGRKKYAEKPYRKSPEERSPRKKENQRPEQFQGYKCDRRPRVVLPRSENERVLRSQQPNTTTELVDGTCQYIAGDDHKKCKAPVSGRTNWCEEHRRKCYQPVMYDPKKMSMPGGRRW